MSSPKSKYFEPIRNLETYNWLETLSVTLPVTLTQGCLLSTMSFYAPRVQDGWNISAHERPLSNVRYTKRSQAIGKVGEFSHFD